MKLIFILIVFGSFCQTRMFGADGSGGFVVGWGYALDGATLRYNTNLVAINGRPLKNISAISAAGNLSGLAIDNVGAIAAWGSAYKITSFPVTLSNVIGVAAGTDHYLALNKDGAIVAWGDDYFDKAIISNNATDIASISIGYESCVATKKDGAMVGWGQNTIPQGLSNIIETALSALPEGENLALKKDHTVIAWNNRDPAFVTPVDGWSNIIKIAVGPTHELALKSDGTVLARGTCLFGETNVPIGLSNVIAIAAGGFRNPGMSGYGFSLALKKDGTITAWGVMGYDTNCPVQIPEGLSNVIAIATSDDDYCYAITTNRAIANKFR